MNWESGIDIYTLLMRTYYIAQGTLPSASGDLNEKEMATHSSILAWKIL